MNGGLGAVSTTIGRLQAVVGESWYSSQYHYCHISKYICICNIIQQILLADRWYELFFKWFRRHLNLNKPRLAFKVSFSRFKVFSYFLIVSAMSNKMLPATPLHIFIFLSQVNPIPHSIVLVPCSLFARKKATNTPYTTHRPWNCKTNDVFRIRRVV